MGGNIYLLGITSKWTNLNPSLHKISSIPGYRANFMAVTGTYLQSGISVCVEARAQSNNKIFILYLINLFLLSMDTNSHLF